jgi:iron complex outermembrane recepter protein
MNHRLGLWCLGFAPFWVSLLGVGTAMAAEPSPPVGDLQSLGRPATSVAEWQAQIAQSQARVTQVLVTPKGNELEISLETADGKPLTIDASKFRAEGNTLVADITNTTLALPTGAAFSAENPTADIVAVQVSQTAPGTIRVSVVGKAALPKTPVILKAAGLAYALNPARGNEDQEVVVTGQQPGYRAPNATTGSKTDTPLRDLPFSVQVVPRQLLEDRKVDSVNEALRTVPGIVPDNSSNSAFEGYNIRGFSFGNILRNGLRDNTSATARIPVPNIEQVEVLRGPAGALFSAGNPGGTVNIITAKPQFTPRYLLEATVGNFGTYAGTVDFTGPLNDSKTLAYRFIGNVNTSRTFIDFFDRNNYLVAPSLTWQIRPGTKLTFEAEFTGSQQPNDRGLPALGTVVPNINGTLPRNRFIGEPNDAFDQNNRYGVRLGYTFEHQFNPNWRLQNTLQISSLQIPQNSIFPSELLADQRTLTRGLFASDDQSEQNYTVDTNIIGNFRTGKIEHKLLFGVDFYRNVYGSFDREFTLPDIDIFNPVYGRGGVTFVAEYPKNIFITDNLGFYLQDQVTLLRNLKLLLGGRVDIANQRINFVDGTTTSQQDTAFSPRVGLVYQPIEPVSLYASYSRNFGQNIGTAFDSGLFQPSRGTQYEVGVKAELLNRRLATTLALYQVTLSNVLTADPINPNFSVQTGEQRSRGIELDLVGEPIPGWKIAAGYAYTNARVTADNVIPVGNRLFNTPEHAVSLWTTYEIQRGTAKGLGFGLGIFYVGRREGDLENSFRVPGYTRTDASIFYRRNNLRVGLNIENLFDTTYFEAVESSLRVFYGAPLTIRGTISWTF